ncbi:TonB-dependent receptor plug domain-containing protein [Sphingobacterium corticibacter]|uniref:TonB-dependent receptor n=1 Tax=Sphingobacterium corticibacter TaxID=2171749 RepID=A0A2T8HGS4_9SPHI|nr:TonB-dependent receptor [Sphingobacterium corticibacter]PVH24610.1 TonB-dependent receptor [Sphingobacterium corticibacter]
MIQILHRSQTIKSKKKRGILAIVGLLTCYTAVGQISQRDTSQISEVIIQENRLQVPFNKNSRHIEIITYEEIRRMPVRTINEVLTHINGVDLRQRGPFGAQADIGIDGGSFEQTLVLVNGIKMSDPQTGHHSLNLPIPLEAIERIEVVRGPTSRIYGINGLTGSVNIVTRQAASSEIFAQAYAGSSFKSVEEEAGRSGVYYGMGYQVGGQFVRDKHQHQLYLTTEKSNGQRYNTASEAFRAFYENKIQLSAQDEIQVMGGYIDNKFGANGFYAAPGDVESEEVVRTAIAAVSSRHDLNDRLRISPRLSYRNNTDDYRYFRNDLSRARSEHETDVWSAELNARYHTNLGDVGVGAESRWERIESTNIGNHRRQNHGYYAEFRTEYIQDVLLNVGTYVNYNSQYGWQAFPGIDVAYHFLPQWRIAANVGSSQRIPSFTDLYLDQRPGNIGNPDLQSENAWQAEGSLRYQIGNFTAQAGYFYRNVAQFIDWQRSSVDEPYQAVNVDNNRMRGLHFSSEYGQRLSARAELKVRLGYTYLNPSVVSTTDGLISRYRIENLKHQLNSTISLGVDAWTFSTTNRFIERASNTAYVISDIRAAYQIGAFTVFADLQNLWDVTYVEAGAVPMPGRWQTLGLRYTKR